MLRWLMALMVCIFGLQAANTNWPDPWTYQKRLHVGINVNWGTFGKEIRQYDAQIPKDFAEIGFDHIRIRFKDPETSIFDDATKYWEHLERLVRDVLSNGMTPILAFDAADFKLHPDEEHMQRALDIWAEASRRFRDYSPELAFDLIIEPAKDLSKNPEILNEFYEKAVKEIREENPKRIIFIAPHKIAHPDSLPKLKIPSEANGYLMIETHFYAAGPSPTLKNKKWTTGTPEEKALLEEKLQQALDWQEEHDIPVWIGAIMPGDYNKGDHYSIPEQVHFSNFISCLFRAHHVPFAINADQQFYDLEKRQWRNDRFPVLQAILHPPCLTLTAFLPYLIL